MNPALRRHFLHQVRGLLDILLENRDLRRVLLAKELFRNRTTFLTHAHLFGMDQ